MNTPERDNRIYPIGYMITGETNIKGPIVNIVDMRDLDLIQPTQLTGSEVTPICEKLNENLRNGLYEGDGWAQLILDAGAAVGNNPEGVAQPVLANVSESEVPAQAMLPKGLELPAFPKGE